MQFFKKILNENYKIDKNFENSFESWQKSLIKGSIYISLIVLIIEFIFLFFYILSNNLDNTKYEYFMNFILKPGLINFLSIFLISFIWKKNKKNIMLANFLPLFLLIVVFSNIVVTHYVYSSLYLILIIPILLSTIYADKKIEFKTFIFSFIAMLISFIIIDIGINELKHINYYYNMVVSFIALFIVHFLAKGMIKNESLKEDILKNHYNINSSLLEDFYKDGFTKLFNHTALFNLLDYYINGNFKKNNFYIAVIDVDNFKKINDNYGHEAGNAVLIDISTRLINLMEKYQNIFVSRYGGDEICVVFYNYSKKDVFDLLEKFRKETSKKKFNELKNGNITISIGIASYDNENSNEFFDKADKMLYEAKKQGRNRVVSD